MPSQRLEPVAVVGIGCRFPGAANADEYWRLIESGRTAISTLPESRLDRDLYFHPKKGRIGSSYTELAGLVPETPFDHHRFPIPDELARTYDSVHLRMLEVCCEAVVSAGMDPLSSLVGSRTGVYIGNTSGSTLAGDLTFRSLSTEAVSRLHDSEFADLPEDLRARVVRRVIDHIHSTSPMRNADGGPNVEAHDVALLVSRAMQLDGPSVAVDAACASSLMSTAQAVNALQRGYLDMAIAGGCSYSKWFALVLFSQAQSISGTGSRPFDRDADGLISSDGYAAIVLKPLSKAQADGDPVLAVIRSLSIGSDGKGKSLWAPRREGQIHTVRKAYNSSVTAGSLQYIECHATSTQVGDATEVSALTEAMDGAFPTGQKIPIGSVKGNIGHTLECAGLAGICKTIQALRYGVIPPQPSVSALNPEIAWDDIPFYVPTSPQPWTELNEHGVRRAAVNAFGIGGLNAHFVLDDRPEPQRVTQSAVAVDMSPEADSADADLIAVVGVGVITPDANNQDEFWSLVSSGKSATSEVTDDRWLSDVSHSKFAPGSRSLSSNVGGFIRNFEFDWKKHRIPPRQIQNSNPLQYMLLDAADQAFHDAGMGDRKFPGQRASVVVGTMFGGDFSGHMQVGLRLPVVQRELKQALVAEGIDEAQADLIVERYREYALNIYPAVRDETGSFTSSTLASRLTKTFDLMDGAWAVDGSDVSSLVCFQAAADLLVTGASDLVMCAAGQRSMDIESFEVMDLQGNLSSGSASPAFDDRQNGGVPGEAVGVVLLKRLADAERDGNRIRGIIRGIEVSFSDRDPAEAIAKNLKRLFPEDSHESRIDALEVARICDPALDAAEIRGMKRALPVQAATLPLGSTSGQIGCTLSVSGMISFIKALLELEHQSVAPVADRVEPSELIRHSGSQFSLPHQMAPLGHQLPPGAGRILISNIDPAGSVGHLIVEGVSERMNMSSPSVPVVAAEAPPRTPAKPTSLKILRVTARSTAELEAAVAANAMAQVDSFSPGDKVRLGIVATGENDLTRKLAAAKTGLADVRRRQILRDNGILITEPEVAAKRVAVVFSGQGAQYTGMLTDWVQSSPAMRAFIRRADATLASLNLPSFEFLTQDEAADLGDHVLNTQLAVLLADLASWAALQEAGVRPDFIAGHSYGEFPALVAAGAWDLNAAVKATIHRTQAVEGTGITNAAMVSTTATSDTVNELIQKLHIPCDIACYNAPDQTIVAGRISDLDQLSEELKTGGYASRTIRVPMPYHSRLMQAAGRPLASALAQIPINTPEIRFISCCSCRPLDTPEEIRMNLVAQLTDPVRWETLVETLIASDTGILIESGPRQILTRLNRSIIDERSVIHLALDARPGHAEEQQARIALLREMIRTTSIQPVAPQQPPQPTPPTRPPSAASAADNSTSLTAQKPAATNQTVTLTAPENFSMTDIRNKGRIIRFDATERRRTKMREAAQAGAKGRRVPLKTPSNGAAPASDNGVPSAGPTSKTIQDNTPSDNGVESAPAISPVPVPTRPVVPAVSPSRTTAATMTPPAPSPAPPVDLSRDKLESFVLDYVVEQTGYPPELVELDGDLEADLAIDSIRKAQLMGEITETFGIEQAKHDINDLSLDDFPHLNSIIDFFLRITESPDAVHVAASGAPQAPVVAPMSTVPATPVFDAASPPVTPPSPVQVPLAAEDLENFAIRFVVEQTGYPEELVELDTDLEADLGIDSIRKAQLLGDIAENYHMTDLATQITDMSLDDFPTLNSIVSFFVAQAGTVSAAGPESDLPSSAPPVAASPTVEVVTESRVPPVTATPVISAAAATPITPASPVTSATPAASATPMATIAVPTVEGAPAAAPSKAELMAFSISFVVEQTGYPEELVEPDADLEADLGIDSIRKAQLLSEIAEHYHMTDLASQITDLSLDDFPTLATITDFFLAAAGRTTEHGADADRNSAVLEEDTRTQSHISTAVSLAQRPTPSDRGPENNRIMQRYVIRAIPEALSETGDATGTAFAGKLVILGDNQDAQSLAQCLQAVGSAVEVIPVTANPDAAVSAFEASWNRAAVQHLVVMTSSGAQPDDWDVLRDQQLLIPYFVIQRWVQLRKALSGTTTAPAGNLAAITRLGGDFGIGRRIGNVSGAGLAGLFKAIIREHPEINATVLDTPADEPIRLVIDALCREVEGGRSEVEVGCIRGSRYRLRMAPQPAASIRPLRPDLSGPWVVTGGARGITARVATALGQTPGVQLHLVGRSPEPKVSPARMILDEAGLKELKTDVMRTAAADGRKPIDAWNELISKIELAKSLQDLRNQGLELTYHSCDVSDRNAVGTMLDTVRRLHGPITGVIHGAGIEAAARFDRKNADSVRQTVAAKVDGARWLWDHTAGDNLSFFVGFGSTSGRFGGLGQTDYSMSSDLLCRMGWQFGGERPNCRVFGIHWPPWSEVGMATRPESQFALESAGLKFVEPDEGVSHLIDELGIRACDGEVAIVDRDMSQNSGDRLRDARFITLAHHVADRVRSFGFVDGIISHDSDSLTTELSIDPVKYPLVADHVVDGTPVVPGTMLLEACLQAAELLDHGRMVVEAREFDIKNGVRCPNGKMKRVRVNAIRQADGSIKCLLTAEFRNRQNQIIDPVQPIATVRVILADVHPAGSSESNLPSNWEILQQSTSPQDFDPHHVGSVYHGPSMGRLKGAIINDGNHGWFRIADPGGGNTLPGTDRPAILDAILQGTDVVLQRCQGFSQVIMVRGIDRITFHQPLKEQYELISHSVLASEEDGSTVWNERCFTPDGRAAVTTEGHRSYQLKSRLSKARLASRVAAAASDTTRALHVEPITPPEDLSKKLIRPLMLRADVNVEGNAASVAIPVSPVADRFLREHRLHNVPLLPAAMAVEIMAEAAEVLAKAGEHTIAVREMQILSGIKCAGTDVRTLVVQCQRSGNDVLVQLFESSDADGASMTATIALGVEFLSMEATLSQPHGEFMDYPYPKDAPIQHGPSFQTLKRLAPWRYLGTAHLQIGESWLADDFPAEARWVIDPAILDGAIVACGVDAWLYYGFTPELPHSFDEIIVGRVPQSRESCVAEFHCCTTFKKDTTTYNLILQDSTNRTFMQVNGFSLKRLIPVKPGWLTLGGY